jgi:hypothetical protein
MPLSQFHPLIAEWIHREIGQYAGILASPLKRLKNGAERNLLDR